ncbi:MAG TPA: hypothetical protein VKB84_25750 [Candidatus Binataceae bacterium]|nr:hypothetical protein [Candidatus Binataceae bacterium]
MQRSFSESTAGEQSKFANDAAEAALETRETAGLAIWLFKKIFDIRRRRTRNAGGRVTRDLRKDEELLQAGRTIDDN